ncbi:MAG TPA: hypothetical protein VK666_15640, partial [Chryseolinea sp.]|nr:hypothetical protein [Chryseolinea sp.]
PSRVEQHLRKVTLRRWQRIYKQDYSSADFDIAFKSEAYASKNHPKNYQHKILEIYADRLRSFELNSVMSIPHTQEMTKV